MGFSFYAALAQIFGLKYDHIRPIALGGQSNLENIRLVCRAHNQLYATSLGLSANERDGRLVYDRDPAS